jgi:hypothetical protein
MTPEQMWSKIQVLERHVNKVNKAINILYEKLNKEGEDDD